MVNESLVEGLKTAIVKGESLNQAMMSFYNSGYDKAEVEEAARFLQSLQTKQPTTSKKITLKTSALSAKQNISNYPQKPKTPRKMSIILIIISLIILSAGLISIFIFNQKIINFFDGLF